MESNVEILAWGGGGGGGLGHVLDHLRNSPISVTQSEKERYWNK